MGWVFIIFFFGSIAALLFLASLAYFTQKCYKTGLLFACLELLAAVPPTLAWMDALWNSGKIDWLLLGLLSYTPFSLCFYAMFIAGAVCLVLNIRGIRRKKPPAVPGTGQETDGGKVPEQTKVQKLARVLRVMVVILFVCNLLALFFVPGVAVMGGFHGLRQELARLWPYTDPWELSARMLVMFAMCWNPKMWPSAEPAVVVICLTLSGLCTAAILWQGKRVLETVIRGNPFTGENAVSLRRAAVYCWFISGAAAVRFLWLFCASGPTALFTYNTLFIPVFLVGGLLCMVMSALFRQAAEMKEDQDLTI